MDPLLVPSWDQNSVPRSCHATWRYALAAALGFASGLLLFGHGVHGAAWAVAPALRPALTFGGFAARRAPSPSRPLPLHWPLRSTPEDDAYIVNDRVLQELQAMPPAQQLQAVGERLVILVSRIDPGLATAITGKLLERGLPECIRLLQNSAELGPLVQGMVDEVNPPVVIKPDPAAAATHRIAEAQTGRAAFVTNNWWKETREQYKGFGEPTPEVLRRLRIRSMTAADLGQLGPWLLTEARREKEGPAVARDWKVLFSVSTGRGSAVMVYRDVDGEFEITHLVANTMLPGEGDAQLALVQHLAKIAQDTGKAIRMKDTVPPTLFGDLADFGFNDQLEFKGFA